MTTPQAHEAIEHYEPLGEDVEGTAHVETVTVTDEPEGDSEHYVEALAVEATVEPSWNPERPPFILSEVEIDHPNGPITIGWDTCGRCHLHIRICKCADGPEQPEYVRRWHRKSEIKKAPERLTAGEQARLDAAYPKRAVVAADPDTVEQAVTDALEEEERTPTGRKKRADAGMKRGPRKKGTPDSVLEAAGDLSAAMSKES